jgi:hypothetical protein
MRESAPVKSALEARRSPVYNSPVKRGPVAAAVGLTMLVLSACGSARPPAATSPRVTTYSCARPSHYYSVAEVTKAFAAHGIALHPEGTPPPAAGNGAISRALHTGQLHELLTNPISVIVSVPTPRAPLRLTKLLLSCGTGPSTPRSSYVRGNVGVLIYKAAVASTVKKALTSMR